MPAPVNVKLQAPTITIPDWPQQAKQWEDLNQALGGNPGFYPLTIKVAYVIGVIHDICESVSLLLKASNVAATYIPAYGVFASGVELLGRCIKGNPSDEGSGDDLKIGFRQLRPSAKKEVVKTSKHTYTRGELVALRHFASHGQAVSKAGAATTHHFGSIDTELLGQMLPLVRDGLERYWSELQVSEVLCNRLARANIIALRDWPVLNSWTRFQQSSVTAIFDKFDWNV